MASARPVTWISGRQNGLPILLNVQTGETRLPPAAGGAFINKKRQRCASRGKERPKQASRSRKATGNNFRKLLNHVATDVACGHWVVGRKDGRIYYYNTITKESRFTPPEVLKNPAPAPDRGLGGGVADAAPFALPVPTAAYVKAVAPVAAAAGDMLGQSLPPCAPLPAAAPTADGCSANAMELDDHIGEVRFSAADDQELFQLLSLDPALPHVSDPQPMVQGGRGTPTAAAAAAESRPPISKSELKKLRNREAAVRSRLKKQGKLRMLEARIEQLQSEKQVLKQQLAAKEAQNVELQDQVAFLRTLVTARVEKDSRGMPIKSEL